MASAPLSAEVIIGAAIDLLDRQGLEGFTMRALGKTLRAAATAVYWHVGSKEDVIALAGDRVWQEITLPDWSAIGWRAAAVAMATELQAMITRHPWLMQVFGSFVIYGVGKARYDDHSLAIYEAAGFDGSRALQASSAVFIFVLGHALGTAGAAAFARKQRREGRRSERAARNRMSRARDIAAQFPRLRAHLETTVSVDDGVAPEHTFEIGLDAILDGLVGTLPPPRKSGPRRIGASAKT